MEIIFKTCRKCGESKPLEELKVSKTSKYGRDNLCRRCNYLIASDWVKKNPEKYAEHQKRSRQKNKDKLRESQKEWRRNNRDMVVAAKARFRAQNKEKCAAYEEAYRLRNLHKMAKKTSDRRAAELKAIPKWADHDAMRALYALAARKSRRSGMDHHVDHIVPLRSKLVCGLHVHTNLQVLSGAENCRKNNKFWPDMP